jgi:hypothetical protein
MTQSQVISDVIADIKARAVLGLAKYGVSLDRPDLSTDDWLEHAYQEALDLACYLRVLLNRKNAKME